MLSDESRRSDLPGLEKMTYLNTAAEGIPPLAVGEAMSQYYRDKQLGMDGRDPHFAEWEKAKQLVAKFYGLSADEVSICSNSSEAFNLAAKALRLKAGDEIVINDLDFPAGATPWLQEDCPATVKVWKARGWELHVEDLVSLLSPQTRLVTTSLVSFFNGHMISLPAVLEAVRQNSGSLVAVDVTQALGRIPLELSDVDLIVSSTHKWILSTHGGGLVGVPAARAKEWTVPAGGWFHLHDAFGPERFEKAVSKPGAAGFTVGMPNFPAVYAIRAALEYIDGIGVEKIAAVADPLVEACLEGVKSLPVEMLTPIKEGSVAGILAFRHEKAEAIHRTLREKNIHVMSHAGRLRVALHGYNTMADVETFLAELKNALVAV